ncbi:MAG: IS1595 family transposase [Acidobacteria bacterium]|nr:IS1595 family transposase [Acidobacteriota bacterium]
MILATYNNPQTTQNIMSKPKNHVANTISITQLLRKFPDDEACIKWLEKIRWDGVPTCNKCGETKRVSSPKSKPNTYWCGKCRKHFTVTTGTILHATKTPLQNWMIAIYSLMTARKGVSALQLSKELGVQYRTAWHMLHRIREACDSGELKLFDVVELDESYIGGKESNKHADKKLNAGRGTVGKVPVIGAKQRSGAVIAKPVQNADGKTATEFAMDSVEEGSTIYTDESRIYSRLPFEHDSVNHSHKEWVRGNVHTNSIESFWALFKRSLHGTWHHVSPKHLHRYANEATMRLNIGNCDIDTIDRMIALVGQIGGRRVPYEDLTK